MLGAALALGGLVTGPEQASAHPSPAAGPSRAAADGAGTASPANRQAPPDAAPRAVATGGPVLAAPVAGPGTLPTTAGLQRDLAQVLQDRGLGTLNFAIADGSTGQFLYGSGETTPATPASTTKLLTAVAVLALLPADARISTRVVKGAAPGEITLVGGGDPTLSVLPQDRVQVGGLPVDAESAPASLTELARQTADALKAAGTPTVKLGYDTSLYSGPLLHKENDYANIAPVTPLMADEGKVDPTATIDAPSRYTDPADQATETFAGLLRAQGITVDGKATQVTAAQGAQQLAEVRSPTIPRLVERTLTTSDNTLAEALARQAALAAHKPASFDGGVAAVTETLQKLGVPMDGVVINDGSGLYTGNLISPLVLAKLLSVAASPEHPELRPVLTGLPIAGFTGTLRSRFGASSGAQNAAGIVRAKTGTLGDSGVFTLAGTVVDADGRVLVFAFMNKSVSDGAAARAATDRAVARLAACGCR